ncbi:MAG: hypothetical protein FK734_00995 [Asgard group archaeon]|nr:hypothetical protein [Asgard group archaeon]
MEVLTIYSLHYIIPGALNIVVLSVFNTLLLVNFFRKRTIGTLLLFFAYFSLWLNEALVTAAFLMEGYLPGNTTVVMWVKAMHITGVLCLVYTINWIYFFGNRHLIRDNDLFKSLYTSVFGAFVGVVGALSFQEIFTNVADPVWYTTIELAEANFNLYYPATKWPYLIVTFGLFAIGSITYLRLAYRTIILQRKAKDIVTKKGLRTVTVSIILLLATGLMLGGYIFGANKVAFLSAILFVLRGLVVLFAVGFGYIGWLMPNWIRKRFRGKAWITKVYTGKIPEPKPSEKNQPYDVTTSKLVEVVDQ